jgi:uncharacterized delta-60 repeat protein
VAGGETVVGSYFAFALARFTSAGIIDPTFSGGAVTTNVGPYDDFGYGLAIQADGKLVMVGSSISTATGSRDFSLARYLPDGSLDSSFGSGGTVTTAIRTHGDIAQAVAIQSNGRIVVGGSAVRQGSWDFAVARYLAS